MSGVSKGDMGRDFMKTARQGHAILAGEQINIVDMHPGERMMLLLDLAEAVQSHVPTPDLVRNSNGFTEEMMTNFFRFLNTQVSWQETIVVIRLLKHQMDVSFVEITDMGLPECKEFASRMRDYLRGIV